MSPTLFLLYQILSFCFVLNSLVVKVKISRITRTVHKGLSTTNLTEVSLKLPDVSAIRTEYQ